MIFLTYIDGGVESDEYKVIDANFRSRVDERVTAESSLSTVANNECASRLGLEISSNCHVVTKGLKKLCIIIILIHIHSIKVF